MRTFVNGAMKKNDYLLFQDEICKEKNSLDSKSLQLSIARLIIGLAVLGLLLGGYFANNNMLTILSIILAVFFVMLVWVHNKVAKRLCYLNAQAIVIQRYLDRYDNNWKKFEETGLDYLEKINGVVKDLDIIGNSSLFQYLNTANTIRGKKRLITKLTRTHFNQQLIEREQDAIMELANNNSFVLALETYGRMIEKPKVTEKIIEEFVDNLKGAKAVLSWGIIKYIIPLMTITAIIMFLFNLYFKLAVIIAPILIFGQLVIAVINLNKNALIFEQAGKLSKCLSNYQNISHLTEQTTFTSQHLKLLQQQLKDSTKAFDKLTAISSAAKQRNNLLAFLLLNGILLWDINCRERFDNWVKEYGCLLEEWLDAIGELESLMSLQVLKHTKEITCFAKIHNEKNTYLKFSDAYHPLIQSGQVVANSFSMDKQVCVITGSNMSGKTTFLRTIGINLVLTYAGGMALAKTFDCSLMRIFTSMRIEDDLNGISSFYAELLRVKEIVEANRQGGLMISLIDEIFKGTNSKDRIIGARETVKQLSTPNNFTFITTHDFELCELEDEVSCSNYHFSESYQDNKILFDYSIKDGRCQTTNAQYLLQMVGITK